MRLIRSLLATLAGSLKLKLGALLVALLGLTIGIAPWSAIKVQERQLLRASTDRLRSLHEMLTKTIIATCMLTGDPKSVQQVLEAAAGHADIVGVRLFDSDGLIKYSSHSSERGARMNRAELSGYYGHADPLIVGDARAPIHTLVQPFFNQPACHECHGSEQKILGVLQVSLSLERMTTQLSTLKRLALVATLLTLMVVAVGVWLALTLLVDQPLQELVGVMQQAEHGDLSVRAEVRSRDEIGRLARNFNEMISRLQSAQGEIESYHQEQLARADRLATIGEMAAAIAHEIRNPLTGIRGVLSVLSRDFPSDDPRREVVGQTNLLIDRLNKSVEDILHYSRPSLPQLQLVRLQDVVDRARALIESEAKKKRVQLMTETKAPPPGTDDTAVVSADPYQIQQVIVNLLINAIQATPADGQVSVRIETNEGSEPRELRLVVSDSGKGMTAEEVAKAFQPFFSTKAQGTGLGLPIAKQIVEQHRGRISLHSEPGKGTSVMVMLPIAAPPSEDA
ncbi:MAG TPA: ATP-binding protein [Candidatus Binatia bacterium]|nr:ATP-binding protein [Candidatus Binatia bacterium]